MLKRIILGLSVLFLLNSCLYMMAGSAVKSNKRSIHFLIRQNNYNEVENILLEDPEQANIIEDSILADTPLAAAAYRESYSTDYIKLLLKYGADPNLRGPEKYNRMKKLPFEIAVDMRNYEAAKLLLDAGTDLNSRCSDGRSILDKSFDMNEKLVRDVLSKGAVPDTDRMLFRTLTAGFSRELFVILVDKGLDISAEQQGETLLHTASRFGREKTAGYLLSEGLDVFRKNASGDTPLHAASEGSIRFMNIAGYQSSTPVPVYYASLKTSELLLKAGASVDAENNRGETSLHKASLYGHLDIIRLLVSAGADVNALNKDGFTPLHYSAAGVDMNIQNSNYPAYHSDNPEAAEFLILNGSDIFKKTQSGLTAVNIAEQSGATEDMMKILEKYSR